MQSEFHRGLNTEFLHVFLLLLIQGSCLTHCSLYYLTFLTIASYMYKTKKHLI